MRRFKDELDALVGDSVQNPSNRAELYISVASSLGRNQKQPLCFLLAIFSPIGTPEDAEDALQEFVDRRLPRIVKKYDAARGPFSALFSRSLKNFGLSYRKKIEAKIKNLDAGRDPVEPADPSPSAEQLLYNAELRELLHEGITHELTEHERAVINLDLEGLSTAEIAEKLGINPNAVEVRRCRAIFKLRKFVLAWV